MKNRIPASRALAAAWIGAVALTGCMSAPVLPPAAAQSAPAPAAAAPPPQSTASALSYGTVTSQVQKGRTTQMDLLQIFGGPNIATTDRDGVETWVYERTATQTDVQTQSQAAQGALNLGLFFRHVELGASGAVGRSATASSVSSSIRSLTVIVKFAGDKTVADYSVRASTF
jgi:hypothetical protein